jgi:hypothetical protein
MKSNAREDSRERIHFPADIQLRPSMSTETQIFRRASVDSRRKRALQPNDSLSLVVAAKEDFTWPIIIPIIPNAEALVALFSPVMRGAVTSRTLQTCLIAAIRPT